MDPRYAEQLREHGSKIRQLDFSDFDKPPTFQDLVELTRFCPNLRSIVFRSDAASLAYIIYLRIDIAFAPANFQKIACIFLKSSNGGYKEKYLHREVDIQRYDRVQVIDVPGVEDGTVGRFVGMDIETSRCKVRFTYHDGSKVLHYMEFEQLTKV